MGLWGIRLIVMEMMGMGIVVIVVVIVKGMMVDAGVDWAFMIKC